MISFKLFTEDINDYKTDEETSDMHILGMHLRKHYHFGTKSIDLSDGRDEFGSPPTTIPPNNQHIKNIHTYTQGETPNNYLWNKHLFKKTPSNNDFEEKTKSLNDSLHYHKTPEDLTVYSSTIHDPRKKKNSQGIMHHPAFISTTIDKDYADYWYNKSGEDENGNKIHHILKIHIPKGSPGAYVEHISAVPGQQEFILPKGSNLKYHYTEKHISPSNKNTINHYHHCTLEPENK